MDEEFDFMVSRNRDSLVYHAKLVGSLYHVSWVCDGVPGNHKYSQDFMERCLGDSTWTKVDEESEKQIKGDLLQIVQSMRGE